MKRITLLFIILVIVTFGVKAQSSENPQRFSVLIGGGFLPRFAHMPYDFRNHPFSSQPNTSFYGMLGVSYLAIQIEGTTSILFSAEALYGRLSTPLIERSWYTGQMKVDRLFLGLWTKLVATSTISPFVRVGGGVLKRHLQELFSEPALGFEVRSSEFAIAAGGGIDWTLSQSLTLSLFGDGVITTKPPATALMVLGVRLYWQV